MIRKILRILLIIVFVLPIVLYASIHIANDRIATAIEKELKDYPLPENTELVDSISIAGKLTGNGNGMQYMGSILVSGELSEGELLQYYSNDFDYIEVRKQESSNIDFINSNLYSFDSFEDANSDTYYSVTCWDYNSRIRENDFISEILDFDLRGR